MDGIFIAKIPAMEIVENLEAAFECFREVREALKRKAILERQGRSDL